MEEKEVIRYSVEELKKIGQNCNNLPFPGSLTVNHIPGITDVSTSGDTTHTDHQAD